MNNQKAIVHEHENDAEKEWRRLALQFDAHRMQAMYHLRCLLENPVGYARVAQKFLGEPPLSGEEVLAQRLREMIAEERKVLSQATADSATSRKAGG